MKPNERQPTYRNRVEPVMHVVVVEFGGHESIYATFNDKDGAGHGQAVESAREYLKRQGSTPYTARIVTYTETRSEEVKR